MCRYMKMITLEKLRDSLRDKRYEVRSRPRSRRRPGWRSSGWSRSGRSTAQSRHIREGLRRGVVSEQMFGTAERAS